MAARIQLEVKGALRSQRNTKKRSDNVKRSTQIETVAIVTTESDTGKEDYRVPMSTYQDSYGNLIPA